MSEEGEYLEEGNLNYKSICCEEIPELFLDKLVAKKHFSKFGKILRFILRPKRLSCTVEYETEEAAGRAYMEGGNFNGHDFVVSYAEHEVAHVQNTEEWVGDPDVQAELEAMSPGQHRFTGVPASMHMRLPTVATAIKPMSARIVKPAPPVFKVEPTQPPTPRVDATVRNELETLLRRPAYTNEDKYRVLDARDKLVRLTTVRQTDIKTAVSTKGSCPDMCPEKERLMRDFQRQVSCFEMNSDDEVDNSSTISHRRAIKEYSRSSADQEVPLSHELRSESVLQMTMLYLMHRIMDLCDDAQTSLGDWFHFVWDRTRSIRKEITQQELCSLAAVQLVEQCARFHIHCAARLVAEDPSVFDKKINAENLTKCLQTLKYMYHDLRIKGVPCPCEAEFRSYVVLLNLGDANFLWELKQLPTNIQHSSEIKRAIAFYNALQNNNYVRFFDMIRSPETSYLSACILLGYFNKLRWRAMEVIIKSHNWRKNAVLLPLTYLTKVLGFEDEQAAANFFISHGLQCDEEERIMLERLKKPDMEYSMDRAMKLVESKRTVSVGECVCGHQLETADIFERHQPHSSFDANGLLKPEAWTAEDQLRGEAAAAAAAAKAAASNNRVTNKQMPIKTPLPPTVKTDSNIFKVPQSSPPISPKQQQQQKLLQQQQLNKMTPPSIFGGDMNKTPLTHGSSGQSTFVSNRDATSASIFKIPTLINAKPTPSFGSTSTSESKNAFFSSIFTPITTDKPDAAAVLSGASIFGGTTAAPVASTSTSNNIFSAAAKQTANIFQQQPKLPTPLKQDNIFQHFTTQAEPNKEGIFAAAAGKTNFSSISNKPQSPVHDAQRRTEALQRMRELEVEQQRKQEQLEEERKKLKDLEEKRARMRIAAERERRLAALELNAVKQTDTQLESMITELLKQLATEELAQHRAFENRCSELTQLLLTELVAEQLEEVAREEYAVMCHDQMILNRYFERWLQHTRKKLQQRKLMECTPLWVSTDTRAAQTAQLLHPRQHENLQMIKRYRQGQPCNFKALLWTGAAMAFRKPIDLWRLIAKQQRPAQLQTGSGGCLQRLKYFKLLLTLPAEMEELPGFESLSNKWLSKYVRPAKKPKTDSDAFICASEHNIALCVRKVSGVLPLQESGQRVKNECDHTDAIICLLSCVNLQQTRKRLHHLLKLSHIFKSVPIAFVVYNNQGGKFDTLQLAEFLELPQLQEEGKICAYQFYGCLTQKCEFRFEAQLAKAVSFVAADSHLSNSDALEMQRLQSLLESCLGEEMWQRWHESRQRNPAFAKICSMPQHVVGLYNAALSQLQNILVSEDWQDYAEFPAELRDFVPPKQGDSAVGLPHFPPDWKHRNRQATLDKLLQQFALPPMTEKPPSNLEDLELWLLNYACRCIAHDDTQATQAGYLAIKALIGELNRAQLQDFPALSTRLELITFLPVIKVLVFAHVNCVLQTQISLPEDVVYRRQALLDYQQSPWWLNYAPITAVTVDYSCCDTAHAVDETIDDATASFQDVDAIIAQAEAATRKAEQNVHCHKTRSLGSTNIGSLTRELDESLHQFEVSKHFSYFDAASLAVDAQLDQLQQCAKSLTPPGRKRRRKADDNGDDDDNVDSATTTEMDAIMFKALNIIDKIESRTDSIKRLQHKVTKLNEIT